MFQAFHLSCELPTITGFCLLRVKDRFLVRAAGQNRESLTLVWFVTPGTCDIKIK
jgi:hypothetical protein